MMTSALIRIARRVGRWFLSADVRPNAPRCRNVNSAILAGEALEPRDLLATLDVTGGILSLALEANERAMLAVSGDGALSIQSDQGIAASAVATSLGFGASSNPGGTLTSNDAVFALIDAIAVRGGTATERIAFTAGNFAARIDIDAAVERVVFQWPASFQHVQSFASEENLLSAPSGIAQVATGIFEMLGAGVTVFDCGVVSNGRQVYQGDVRIVSEFVQLESSDQVSFFGAISGVAFNRQTLDINADGGVSLLGNGSHGIQLGLLIVDAVGTINFRSKDSPALAMHLTSIEQSIVFSADFRCAESVLVNAARHVEVEPQASIELVGGIIYVVGQGELLVRGALFGYGSVFAETAAMRIAQGGYFGPGARASGSAGTDGVIAVVGANSVSLQFDSGSTFAIGFMGQAAEQVHCSGAVYIASGALLDIYAHNPATLDPHRFPIYYWPFAFISTSGQIYGKFTYSVFHEGDHLTLTPGHGVNQFAMLATIDYNQRYGSESGVTFTPTKFLASTRFIAVAGETGSNPLKYDVFVYDSVTSARVARFKPYGSSFRGEIRVAVGDVNGDRIDDIVIVNGGGRKTQVRIYDGRMIGLFDGATSPDRVAPTRSFYPFGKSFADGAFIATVNVNQDRPLELVVGSDGDGPSQVRLFHGVLLTPMYSFSPFGGNSRGGVTVAGGDLNRDGIEEIIVGRASGSPQIRIFDGASLAMIASFKAFSASVQGVFVAAGDVDGDGDADVIAGSGAGSRSEVRIFDGGTLTLIDRYRPYPASFLGGVRVAATNVDGDAADEIVMGSGPGLKSKILVRHFDTRAVAEWKALSKNFSGGVYVG